MLGASDKAASAEQQHDDSGVFYQPIASNGLKAAMKSKYVVLCCLTAAIGGFSFGYDQGLLSVILVMPSFLTRFRQIDATQTHNAGFYKGLVTAILELGGAIGALAQSFVADRFGRRRAMQVASVVFIVGAIIQTAAQNYSTLAVGRFIGGFGVGMLALVAPVYMGEISPAEIRGSLMVLEEWFIVIGAVVAFWVTYGTRYIPNEWAYRLPFMLQIFPVLYLAVVVFWMPASPRWLAEKGRDQEALMTLSKLRGLPENHPNVRAEWMDVIVEATFQREVLAERHSISLDRSKQIGGLKDLSAFGDLFRANCWNRTLVGTALVFFQEFVGINALIYYAPTIFSSIGLSYEMSLLMTGIMNIVQFVGVTANIPLMDKAGRKNLLLFGSVGMFASQLCLAVVVGLYSTSWATHAAQGWVGTAFIFWYMFAFGISWGPISWAMPAEIFPSALRAKGTAFSQAMQWLFNFIIGLVTPPMILNIGYGTYVFFAVFCLLSFVWAIFLCPETSHKTLEEMDEVFKDHSGRQEVERKQSLRAELVAKFDGPLNGRDYPSSLEKDKPTQDCTEVA